MRLTVKSEYGLLAMIELASRSGDTPVSAREVAERQEIPAKFMEQIFVAMRRAGLVAAVRGAHGGFVLGRPADEITVLDVVEAVDGPLVSPVCDGERGSICARTNACAAGEVWGRATSALKAVFAASTLAELVASQREMDANSRHAARKA